MKKTALFLLSVALLITLCACAAEDKPPASVPVDESTENFAISEDVSLSGELRNTEPDDGDTQTPLEIGDIPAPFGNQGGGDGNKYFIQRGVDKFDDVNQFFWDSYAKYYLGYSAIDDEGYTIAVSDELSLPEWYETDKWVDYISYSTGLLTYPNIYSLAAVNNIPMEVVVEAINNYNEYYADLFARNVEQGFLPSDDKYSPLYSDEDIAVILTRNEAEILAHFASPYAIVIGEKVYTPAWLYYHAPEDYEAAGITPEMIERKLPLYNEFTLTDEARTAFEEKLSEFIGQDVRLNSAEGNLS